MQKAHLSIIAAILVGITADATAEPKQTYVGAAGKYEMCMKRSIIADRKKRKVQAEPPVEVKRAIAACRKIAPSDAEDVQMSILECGAEPGDASPDMGCDL